MANIPRSSRGRIGRRHRSGRLAENRLEHAVRAADVVGPPAPGDKGEELFRLLARYRRCLVGTYVREVAQRYVERDRDTIQAVDRNRFLAALDLADKFAGKSRATIQPLLSEGALLAVFAVAALRTSSRVAQRVRQWPACTSPPSKIPRSRRADSLRGRTEDRYEPIDTREKSVDRCSSIYKLWIVCGLNARLKWASGLAWAATELKPYIDAEYDRLLSRGA